MSDVTWQGFASLFGVRCRVGPLAGSCTSPGSPSHAVGILDFYHAAGQLWEAAEVTFGFRPSAQTWFHAARHNLRHGQVDAIVACLQVEAKAFWRANDRRKVLRRVADYLDRHRAHLRFPDFKDTYISCGGWGSWSCSHKRTCRPAFCTVGRVGLTCPGGKCIKVERTLCDEQKRCKPYEYRIHCSDGYDVGTGCAPVQCEFHQFNPVGCIGNC